MTRIKIIPSRKRYGVPGNHPVRDRGRAPAVVFGPAIHPGGIVDARRRSYRTCHPSARDRAGS